MNDFTILHLSDLHINREGKQLSVLMENLLKDIKSEMRVSDDIIIVITGDILEKANYKYRENALTFFNKLRRILGRRIRGLYIAPGNHDKVRNILDKKILKKYYSLRGTEESDKLFSEQYWKHLRMGFDQYTELVRDIYGCFHLQPPKQIISDTYGVDVLKVNGKNICFLVFNTAWSCLGDKDERHLKIGNFQMEAIKKGYLAKQGELCNKGMDLTIAIAHHPIDWLDGEEESMVKREILCNNSLNANIYICGHIHNRDVINWQNNRHSMTTLVSGLGWPDGNLDHPYAHTYSSYVFNLDVNSIDVYVRSSDDNYSFDPDFRIYTEKRNKEQNKIVMPINTCKNQAYFNLDTVKDRSPKACFITDEIVEDVKKCSFVFGDIRGTVAHHLNKVKYDVFEFILLDSDSAIGKENVNQEKTIIEVENFLFRGEKRSMRVIPYLKKFSPFIEMQFTTYLQQACKAVYGSFHNMWPDSKIRIHFRYWDGKKEENYRQLCVYGEGADKNYIMKGQQWGELLQRAYEVKRPLIASVNRRYCKESLDTNAAKKSKKWVDFISVIPKFNKNYYINKDPHTDKIIYDRPLLTFGVTIYREQDKKILYVLDYL